MSARKHPPKNAAETIERLAEKGHSTIGVAKHLGVAQSTVRRWFDETESLQEAYDRGRDTYRQNIEEQIVAMGLAGKNPAGLIYILKAKFRLYDVPTANTKLDVAVAVANPVMVVTSHGSDEEWAAKCAAQQQTLMQGSAPVQLEAPKVVTSMPVLAAPACEDVSEAPKQPVSAPSWRPGR
jgi:transposase